MTKTCTFGFEQERVPINANAAIESSVPVVISGYLSRYPIALGIQSIVYRVAPPDGPGLGDPYVHQPLANISTMLPDDLQVAAIIHARLTLRPQALGLKTVDALRRELGGLRIVRAMGGGQVDNLRFQIWLAGEQVLHHRPYLILASSIPIVHVPLRKDEVDGLNLGVDKRTQNFDCSDLVLAQVRGIIVGLNRDLPRNGAEDS